MLQFLIPMAGAGRRFAEAGYRDPKPFIYVEGRPMVAWVVEDLIESYRPDDMPVKFVLLHRREHREYLYWLSRGLQNGVDDFTFVEVPELTEGAACTALLAKTHLDMSEPLVIANADQRFRTLNLGLGERLTDHILTFNPSPRESKWSYVETGDEGEFLRVVEKPAVPPKYGPATIGVYGFERAGDFVDAARAMIDNNDRTNGEFYIAPVFNYLDRAPAMYDVEEMHGLGTPEDLERYLWARRGK